MTRVSKIPPRPAPPAERCATETLLAALAGLCPTTLRIEALLDGIEVRP